MEPEPVRRTYNEQRLPKKGRKQRKVDKDQLKRAEDCIDELLEDVQTHCEVHKQSLEDLKEMRIQVKGDFDEKKKHLESINATREKLKNEQNKLQNQLGSLRENANDLDSKLRELEKEIDELNKETQKLEDEKYKLEAELKDLKNEIEAAERERHVLSQQQTVVQNDLEALKRDAQYHKEEMDEARKNKAEQTLQIEKHEAMLSNIEEKIMDTEQKREEQIQAETTAMNNINFSREKEQRLKEAVQRIQQRIQEISNQILSLRNQILSLENQLANCKDYTTNHSKRFIGIKYGSYTVTHSRAAERAVIQSWISRIQNDINNYESSKRDLINQKSNKESDIEAEKLIQHNEENKRVAAVRQQQFFSSNLESYRTKESQTKTKISQTEAKIKKFELDYQNSRNQHNLARMNQQQKDAHLKELTQSLQEWTTKKTNLESKLTQVDQTLDVKKSTLKDKNDKKNKLLESINQCKQSIIQLEAQLQKTNDELNYKEHQAFENNNYLQRSEQDLNKTKKFNQTLLNEKTLLENRKDHLEKAQKYCRQLSEIDDEARFTETLNQFYDMETYLNKSDREVIFDCFNQEPNQEAVRNNINNYNKNDQIIKNYN